MRRRKIKKELRKEVWEKYGSRCAYCGKFVPIQERQVDHIVPLKRWNDIVNKNSRNHQITDYGVDSYENLNPSCRVCNHWKGVYTVEEFRHEIKMQTSRVLKRTSGLRLALTYGLVKICEDVEVKFYFEGGQRG